MWSQGEYGPHHAIYRILRILKEENIKATFLTCGAIAERFPEAVQAILDHGHVVEGHGYNHEIARYLPRDQEDAMMKKTIAMIEKRTGRRCYGWRSCTQSTNTLELLIENGYVFNTNCFHEEMPFLYENNGKVIVELPRQPFGDGTLFGHRHGEYGNPFHGLESWKAYFDELYSESTPERPKYIPFTMHPYIIGRPGRATVALRGILQHMKKAGRVVPDRHRPRRVLPEQPVQGRRPRSSARPRADDSFDRRRTPTQLSRCDRPDRTCCCFSRAFNPSQ